MKQLEKILDDIQARKVSFNRKKFIEWLRIYAEYYQRNYAHHLPTEEIMKRKARRILEIVDNFYWEYDMIMQFNTYPKSKIPECCQDDYENKRI